MAEGLTYYVIQIEPAEKDMLAEFLANADGLEDAEARRFDLIGFSLDEAVKVELKQVKTSKGTLALWDWA